MLTLPSKFLSASRMLTACALSAIGTWSAWGQFPADHFDKIEPSAAIELPGTQRLSVQGDIASELVSGVDRFLLKQIESSIQNRE